MSQRRRTQVWLTAAAILDFVVGGWLWVRTHHALQPQETAVLDLRGLSVTRGEDTTQTNQPPPELRRTAKHLIVDLPIGSQEGAYDVALLSDTGHQILSASGVAKLEDHVVNLRADVDVGGVRPGLYYLTLRQPGLEWRRYLVRVP